MQVTNGAPQPTRTALLASSAAATGLLSRLGGTGLSLIRRGLIRSPSQVIWFAERVLPWRMLGAQSPVRRCCDSLRGRELVGRTVVGSGTEPAQGLGDGGCWRPGTAHAVPGDVPVGVGIDLCHWLGGVN
jgi:hypothetical protein